MESLQIEYLKPAAARHNLDRSTAALGPIAAAVCSSLCSSVNPNFAADLLMPPGDPTSSFQDCCSPEILNMPYGMMTTGWPATTNAGVTVAANEVIITPTNSSHEAERFSNYGEKQLENIYHNLIAPKWLNRYVRPKYPVSFTRVPGATYPDKWSLEGYRGPDMNVRDNYGLADAITSYLYNPPTEVACTFPNSRAMEEIFTNNNAFWSLVVRYLVKEQKMTFDEVKDSVPYVFNAIVEVRDGPEKKAAWEHAELGESVLVEENGLLTQYIRVWEGEVLLDRKVTSATAQMVTVISRHTMAEVNKLYKAEAEKIPCGSRLVGSERDEITKITGKTNTYHWLHIKDEFDETVHGRLVGKQDALKLLVDPRRGVENRIIMIPGETEREYRKWELVVFSKAGIPYIDLNGLKIQLLKPKAAIGGGTVYDHTAYGDTANGAASRLSNPVQKFLLEPVRAVTRTTAQVLQKTTKAVAEYVGGHLLQGIKTIANPTSRIGKLWQETIKASSHYIPISCSQATGAASNDQKSLH